ncbi:MAG: hypothetical protein ACREQC_11030, partial [Candidatus Binataceae bacterium]
DQGSTLEIKLPASHAKYEFGIQGPEPEQAVFLMSFSPRAADKIRPAIPSKAFAEATRLTLKVSEARGSDTFDFSPPQWCFPRVDDPPQLIFSKPGDYMIQTGPALGVEQSQIAAECTVHYAPQSAKLAH